jgi:hypothetical protein
MWARGRTCAALVPQVRSGSKAEKLRLSKSLLLFPQQRTFINATTADFTLIDAAREDPELIDKFADWLIALGSSGLFVLNFKNLAYEPLPPPPPVGLSGPIAGQNQISTLATAMSALTQ